MKLGALVNNREVLSHIRRSRLDGKRALRLRKIIGRFYEELKPFDDAKNEFIREHGEKTADGDFQIKSDDPKYAELLQYLNDMAATEIDDGEPIFTRSDLERLDLSVEDIDGIEALGLLKGDE